MRFRYAPASKELLSENGGCIPSENISVDFPDNVVSPAGFDPVDGARPLKHAIQNQIENPLAQEILNGRHGAGDTVTVSIGNGGIVFS